MEKLKAKWGAYQEKRKAHFAEQREWKQTQDDLYRQEFRAEKLKAIKLKAKADAREKVLHPKPNVLVRVASGVAKSFGGEGSGKGSGGLKVNWDAMNWFPERKEHKEKEAEK